MKLSNANKVILRAVEMGYTVTKDGTPLSPGGVPLAALANRRKPSKDHPRGQPPYRQFTMYLPEKKVDSAVRIHRLVGYLKYGDSIFEKGTLIRHRDEDSLNNSWDNIILGTNRDNAMDRSPKARLEHARVAAKVQRKLTRDEAEELRQLREEGWTLKELCVRYGIAKSTASYIYNNKTYQGKD